MLTQPSLFVPNLGEPRMIHHHLGDYNHTIGVGFALFGSLNNALVFVCCRKIGTQVHSAIHPFYFAMMSIVGGLLAIILTGQELNPLTSWQFMILSICGICSWIQQIGQSMALRYEMGARTAAVNYIVVLNSFIFDIFYQGDTVKSTDILGAIFIAIFTLSSSIMKCFGKNQD